MNAVLSAAGSWVVAVAIAAPIIILFWWARRTAPVGQYEMDYSVGRRSRPPADGGLAVAQAAPNATADAPVLANPAALAPPAEAAAPAASTVALPTPITLPPEPASAVPAVPTAAQVPPAPVKAALPPGPAPAPSAPAAAPLPSKPAPRPIARAIPTPAKPPVAAPKPVAAAKPEPVSTPEPEPTPAPAEAQASAPAAAAAAAPEGENDDFSRLYGPDAAAIAALHAAGIVTYRQLSSASIDRLKEILAAAGSAGVDPATWPQQGRFAAGGKWKQLDARFKG